MNSEFMGNCMWTEVRMVAQTSTFVLLPVFKHVCACLGLHFRVLPVGRSPIPGLPDKAFIFGSMSLTMTNGCADE